MKYLLSVLVAIPLVTAAWIPWSQSHPHSRSHEKRFDVTPALRCDFRHGYCKPIIEPRCNKKHGYWCKRTLADQLRPEVPCRQLSLIWAQGTTKTETPYAGINLDNIGGLLADEIGMVFGFEEIAVQGLNYTNTKDVISYPTRDLLGGAKRLATLFNETATRCPDTKMIMGGSELGAKVIHEALNNEISPEVAKRIHGRK